MPRVQASVLVPPMFIAQLPHTPSRQDRRNVSVGSTLLLIQISPSSTIGPQSSRSTKNVSRRGFCPSSGFQRYTRNSRRFCAPRGGVQVFPVWILEFFGSVNSTMFDAPV